MALKELAARAGNGRANEGAVALPDPNRPRLQGDKIVLTLALNDDESDRLLAAVRERNQGLPSGERLTPEAYIRGAVKRQVARDVWPTFPLDRLEKAVSSAVALLDLLAARCSDGIENDDATAAASSIASGITMAAQTAVNELHEAWLMAHAYAVGSAEGMRAGS